MVLIPQRIEPNMGSYKAEADLRTKQFTFVKIGTNANEVNACDTQGEVTIGILMNKPNTGEAAEVALPGGSAKLVLDTTLGIPDLVMTGTDGKGEVATAGKWVGAQIDATGVSSVSADDVVPVIVMAFNLHA